LEDDLRRIRKLLGDKLAAFSGQWLTTVMSDLRHGRQFDAYQARTYGLIDQVTD
jgi:hypothetical protein